MAKDQIFQTSNEYQAAEAGFINDAALANSIRTTNELYKTLDADFYRLVEATTVAEQSAAYDALRASDTQKYYEKVGKYYDSQLARLDVAIAKRDELLNPYMDVFAAIDAQAEKVAAVSESMAAQAYELAAHKKAEYVGSIADVGELNEEIEQVQLIVSAIEAKYYSAESVAPLSIPLPQILVASGLAIKETVSGSDAVEERSDAAPTSERQSTIISMRLGLRMLRIGQRERAIRYGSSKEHQTDYSDLRRRALIFLLENQGKEVTAYEIWDAAHEDKVEFDGSKMVSIRSWLESLTIRHRQRLIVHNGKRGVGSRYMINPDIAVNFRVDYADEAEVREAAPEAVVAQAVVPSEAAEASTTPESQTELVDVGDLAIAAEHLKKFNTILAQYNCLIPEEIVNDLAVYMPNLSRLVEGANGQKNLVNEAVLGYRRAAIERFETVFRDVDKLFEFLDQAGEDSPQYAFANWVLSLENQQPGLNQLALVTKLLKSRVRIRPITDGRRTVVGTQQIYMDEFDSEIELPGSLVKFYRDGVPIETAKAAEEDEDAAEEEAVAASPKAMGEGVEYPIAKNVETETSKPEAKKFDWEDKFKKDLAATLDEIWESGIFSLEKETIDLKTLKLKTKSSIVGTKEAVSRLVKSDHVTENNGSLICKNESELTRELVVIMYMLNSNRKIIGERAPHRAKERGLEIVHSGVASFIKHKQAELKAAK